MEAGEGRLFLGDSAALSLRSKQPIGVKPFPEIWAYFVFVSCWGIAEVKAATAFRIPDWCLRVEHDCSDGPFNTRCMLQNVGGHYRRL